MSLSDILREWNEQQRLFDERMKLPVENPLHPFHDIYLAGVKTAAKLEEDVFNLILGKPKQFWDDRLNQPLSTEGKTDASPES